MTLLDGMPTSSMLMVVGQARPGQGRSPVPGDEKER